MAMFRITIDAFLDISDTATRDKVRDGIIAIQDRLKKASAVETSRITVHRCYHDETPPRPCDPPLYEWEKE